MQDFGAKSTPREPETHRISVGGGVCGQRLIDRPRINAYMYKCWVGCAPAGGLSRAGARGRGGLVAAAAVSTTDSIAAA